MGSIPYAAWPGKQVQRNVRAVPVFALGEAEHTNPMRKFEVAHSLYREAVAPQSPDIAAQRRTLGIRIRVTPELQRGSTPPVEPRWSSNFHFFD